MTPSSAADPWLWQPPRPSRWQQAVSLIRLEGADTLRFLHGQSSQDLERARPGQCLATCCLTPTARVRGLAEVLVDGSGAWLAITAGDAAAIHGALDRVLFPADRVTLGPVQPARLLTPFDGAAEGPPPGQWRPVGLDGEGGWELGGPWRLLLPAGVDLPGPLAALPPLGALAAERWRIQQGLPEAPAEINDELNPFELGLADRVSLSKGCYVGQETLARLATYDGVKQQLRRWCWTPPDGDHEAATGPAAGDPLSTADGERGGRITTALALPAGEGLPPCWIGLALVRRAALDATTLEAAAPGGPSRSLRISRPAAFVDPPVGVGRAAGNPAA